MSARPSRIVDAHVHLWDPARADWYPYLAGQQDIGMGDVSGMARRFDLATYRAEAGDHPVVKWVNVAAATGVHSVDEVLDLDRRADEDGHPDALIGGLIPAEGTQAVLELVDRQRAAARLRGLRPMGRWDAAVPSADVLAGLVERDLIFELMAHPDELVQAARDLEPIDDLVVLVEHTGWPRDDSAEEFALWKQGMAALASLGPRVHCKLSGLAMPLHGMSPESFRPWIEEAVALFGPARCVVASNFPVDGLHGRLDQLFDAMIEVLGELSQADVDAVFASNAERLYRC
jgi:L-fuconolactonase